MPFWLLTRVAVSSARDSSSSAKRPSTSARRAALHDAQPSGPVNAARAASTASSMSDSVPSGTEPIRCSVLGEMTGIVESPDGRTHPPRM